MASFVVLFSVAVGRAGAIVAVVVASDVTVDEFEHRPEEGCKLKIRFGKVTKGPGY